MGFWGFGVLGRFSLRFLPVMFCSRAIAALVRLRGRIQSAQGRRGSRAGLPLVVVQGRESPGAVQGGESLVDGCPEGERSLPRSGPGRGRNAPNGQGSEGDEIASGRKSRRRSAFGEVHGATLLAGGMQGRKRSLAKMSERQ